MKNDAVVRALEKLTGAQVRRSAFPELMGAYGCAVYALEHESRSEGLRLPSMLVEAAEFTPKSLRCHGCENGCAVLAYKFKGDRTYFSGNRCEKIFNNSGEKTAPGENIYPFKQENLFKTDTVRRGLASAGGSRHLLQERNQECHFAPAFRVHREPHH